MLPSRIEGVSHHILAKVIVEMNESLIKEFTVEEIQTALLQLHPTKAPGPNGMSAIFYQKYWKTVGVDVTNMVLNALNLNMSIVDINKTNIALVPKVKHPTKMKEFRPISLSNVVYKLI